MYSKIYIKPESEQKIDKISDALNRDYTRIRILTYKYIEFRIVILKKYTKFDFFG